MLKYLKTYFHVAFANRVCLSIFVKQTCDQISDLILLARQQKNLS